jgi:hypothetical protein
MISKSARGALLAAVGAAAITASMTGAEAQVPYSMQSVRDFAVVEPASMVSGAFTALEEQGFSLTEDQAKTRAQIDSRIEGMEHRGTDGLDEVIWDAKLSGYKDAHDGLWSADALHEAGSRVLEIDEDLKGLSEASAFRMMADGATMFHAQRVASGMMGAEFLSERLNISPEEVISSAPVSFGVRETLTHDLSMIRAHLGALDALRAPSAQTEMAYAPSEPPARVAIDLAASDARKPIGDAGYVQEFPGFAVGTTPIQDMAPDPKPGSASSSEQDLDDFFSSGESGSALFSTSPAPQEAVSTPGPRVAVEMDRERIAVEPSDAREAVEVKRDRQAIETGDNRIAVELSRQHVAIERENARVPVEMNREHVAVEMDRETIPVDLDRERIAVEMEDGRVPVAVDRTRVAVEMDRESIPVDLSRERIAVEMNDGRIPVEMDRQRVAVEMDRERIPVEVNRERIPVELDRQRIPVELDRQRIPVELDRQRIPIELDRQKIAIEMNRAPHEGALGSATPPSAEDTRRTDLAQAVRTKAEALAAKRPMSRPATIVNSDDAR